MRKWQEKRMIQTSSTGWIVVSLRDREYQCDDLWTQPVFHFSPQALGSVTQFLSLGWPCDLFFANGTLANVTPQRPENHLLVLLCSLKNLEHCYHPENYSRISYTPGESTKLITLPAKACMKHPWPWRSSWQIHEPMSTDQNYLVEAKLTAKLQSCELNE